MIEMYFISTLLIVVWVVIIKLLWRTKDSITDKGAVIKFPLTRYLLVIILLSIPYVNVYCALLLYTTTLFSLIFGFFNEVLKAFSNSNYVLFFSFAAYKWFTKLNETKF